MIKFFGLFSLAHIIMLPGFTNSQEEKVNVTVYYETLCPFAKKFIVGQLKPFLKGDLSAYINLRLIPYGKANTMFENGMYSFSCHHGDAECYGNKFQACVLTYEIHKKLPDNLGYNKDAVEFVICLMEGVEGTSDIEKIRSVAEKCSNTEKYSGLKKCVDSRISSEYLRDFGQKTKTFQDPLGNVPTIVYNGVFNKDESDHSERNFKEVFCSKLKSKNLSACSNGGPTIESFALLSIGITVLSLLGSH
ncbi:hypothetical protein JTB14_022900 [Gonioctena quinquepunctata]|nr:hypothetical protein JTB14_022900 [Gonioctena quinquepunctata]